MDVNRYLARINYTGSNAPTAQSLAALQRAHMQAVPFENLDILRGKPIVLDNNALFAKIVDHRRGGFCYELNGLFAALLRSMGFNVSMLSAGVYNDNGNLGPDFDHMALLVTVEQRWLVDVGFGDSFVTPLQLDNMNDQAQDGRAYRIARDDASYILMQRDWADAWKPQCRFTSEPHCLADYRPRCDYQQYSPDSWFTQRRICTRATGDGRLTLSDMRLIATVNGQQQERLLASQAEYDHILSQDFGIVMDS